MVVPCEFFIALSIFVHLSFSLETFSVILLGSDKTVNDSDGCYNYDSFE